MDHAQDSRENFDSLYTQLAGRLRSVAMSRGVPPSEAEELVHDVFATYLVQRPNVRIIERYLIAGVCNASRDYWRRKGTESANRGALPDDAADQSKLEDDVAFRTAVGVMLAQLGDRCRQTLKRFYLEGESAAEIAAAMDTTEAYVWRLLHICRKRARDIYGAITRPAQT